MVVRKSWMEQCFANNYSYYGSDESVSHSLQLSLPFISRLFLNYGLCWLKKSAFKTSLLLFFMTFYDARSPITIQATSNKTLGPLHLLRFFHLIEN
jgi:hypothetical protein